MGRSAAVLTCTSCGEQVRLAADKKTATCPCCGANVTPPALPPRPSEPPPKPAPKPTTLADEWGKGGVVFTTEDDGKPYPVSGGGDLVCPECRHASPKGSKTCKGCGYNFATGEKKPPRTFEPYSNQWEIGLPLDRRRKYFYMAQAVAIPLGLLSGWLEGSFFAFLGPWLVFTGLLALVLGTYDRINLSRNARGQVRLSKTWRIAFFERPALRILVRDYEGLTVGPVNDTGCWEWAILFILFGFFILPGVIWYWLALKGRTFLVALTKDHGYPALYLCRGSEEQMHIVAEAVHEIAELPYSS